MNAAPEEAGLRSPSLVRRLWTYQAERFPLLPYTLLILSFTAASAAYSRAVRGADGFVPLSRLALGVITTLVFFFMLRVLDEHKDREIDAAFRRELPVPRGLITLRELRGVGGTLVLASLAANALLAPRLIIAYALVAAWAALMTREFFVGAWLRAHMAAYLLSHMLIMPAIDVYTTGLDWLAEGAAPPAGLLAFLAVTFMNGVLVEIGRKLRMPEAERTGVDTYTKAWGLRAAPAAWLTALGASATCALLAARDTDTTLLALGVLVPFGALAALPAIRFRRHPSERLAHQVERSSQLWPLLTYLLLGGGPWLSRLLGGAPT